MRVSFKRTGAHRYAVFIEGTSCVSRAVARLDELAPRWRGLRIGQELVIEWPTARGEDFAA